MVSLLYLVSAINPFEEIRQELLQNYDDVKLVSLHCPVEILIERDTKGLYARALLPDGHPEKLYNLTGINDRFDVPEHPDLYLDSGTQSITECTNILFDFIVERC